MSIRGGTNLIGFQVQGALTRKTLLNNGFRRFAGVFVTCGVKPPKFFRGFWCHESPIMLEDYSRRIAHLSSRQGLVFVKRKVI